MKPRLCLRGRNLSSRTQTYLLPRLERPACANDSSTRTISRTLLPSATAAGRDRRHISNFRSGPDPAPTTRLSWDRTHRADPRPCRKPSLPIEIRSTRLSFLLPRTVKRFDSSCSLDKHPRIRLETRHPHASDHSHVPSCFHPSFSTPLALYTTT